MENKVNEKLYHFDKAFKELSPDMRKGVIQTAKKLFVVQKASKAMIDGTTPSLINEKKNQIDLRE